MKMLFLSTVTVFLAVSSISGSVSYAGTTVLVSVDSTGKLGNNHSYEPAISGDGRYVAFWSSASNLVPGDTNGMPDIFVHDRQTGETTLISKSSAGIPGNNDSYLPTISADGRYVAFHSFGNNLAPGDTNGKANIFIHDRQTGETTLISKNSSGIPGNGDSSEPAVSGNGRFVAFWSFADNLVPDDTNGKSDIFIHDRETGETKIISKSIAGQLGDNDSNQPSISDDGLYVAFASKAGNLILGDVNKRADAFVHDSKTGVMKIVSKNSIGKPGNGGGCIVPAISADGRYVAFESEAEDLVSSDTNNKSDVFVHDRQ